MVVKFFSAYKRLPIYRGTGHKSNVGKYVGQMKEDASRERQKAEIVTFLCLC